MDFFDTVFLSETEQIIKYKRQFGKKVKRKVSFKNIADVVLIPCLNEYKSFSNDLWYNENDYNNFKLDFFRFKKIINL